VFDHVTIRVTDRGASERFYNTVLPAIGVPESPSGEHYAEWSDFSLAMATDEEPVTGGLHIGFAAPSRADADAFWRAGTEADYEDDGAPGPRPQYGENYYGAFLLDPDGNIIEAVHHGSLRTGGIIDHLWIRVADVGAAKRFYETIAGDAGIGLATDMPNRAQFEGQSGSFSVVFGTPTENVHIAFPARENSTVDAFHATATGAGYRDNGPPDERPVYHPGYYGAFVLDPDGNNTEVVSHNRR
jgi:catechol 2,3-dioxygenase-like lactoylglutathione lyase family enzyme